MPDNNNGGNGGGFTPSPFRPGPASESVVSLSQAILAPMDALAKAQIHAARSFLNLLLQIGYPHIPVKDGVSQVGSDDVCYNAHFRIAAGGGQTVEVSVPTLALVPVQPLTVEAADFAVELTVKEVAHHRQIQESEQDSLAREAGDEQAGEAARKRPWYLVSDPISVRGHLADPGGSQGTTKQSSIKVNVKLSRGATPTGLSKLLTTMTQLSSLDETAEASK